MEDHRLKAFCLVVELKSFSKAADAKCITQPAMSHLIRSLEEELQVKLINRDGKTVSLTPAGRLVYQQAKDILNLYKNIDNEIALLNKHVHGQLVLATIPTLAHLMLPKVIHSFSQTFPNVEFSIMLGTSDEAVLSISQGLCDLCFFEGSVQLLPAHAEKIADDEMILVAAAAHPLAKKKTLTADDLLESVFIMPESGSSIRDLTEKHLASFGVSPSRLKIGMTVNDPALRMELAYAGLGLAFISSWSAIRRLQEGSLVVLRPGKKQYSREYFMAAQDGTLTPLVETFMKHVRQLSPTIKVPLTQGQSRKAVTPVHDDQKSDAAESPSRHKKTQ
jgi:DNA-binding transcriptional LysR family regulator